MNGRGLPGIPDAVIPAGRCGACPHYARADEVTRCRFCGCEHHVASPYQGHDPQTPPGAEAALESFRDALESARQELAGAADAEVTAELERDAAHRRWMLSPECPPVGVFDGVRTTVAQRDAWVQDRVAGEERAYRLARAARQAAQKKLDVLGKQGSYQQSISKSVGQSYSGQREPGW